jgi:hypothetical protein
MKEANRNPRIRHLLSLVLTKALHTTAMYLKPQVAFGNIVASLAASSVNSPRSNHRASVKVDDFSAFCACVILTSLNQTANAFPAQQLLENISDTLSTADQIKCNDWASDPDYPIQTFANQFGQQAVNLTVSVGAFAPDIYAYCGPPIDQVRTSP